MTDADPGEGERPFRCENPDCGASTWYVVEREEKNASRWGVSDKQWRRHREDVLGCHGPLSADDFN